jgi:hypothetical protein
MAKNKMKKFSDFVIKSRRKMPRPTMVHKKRDDYCRKDKSWKNPDNW